jgi:hypothetical protein
LHYNWLHNPRRGSTQYAGADGTVTDTSPTEDEVVACVKNWNPVGNCQAFVRAGSRVDGGLYAGSCVAAVPHGPRFLRSHLSLDPAVRDQPRNCNDDKARIGEPLSVYRSRWDRDGPSYLRVARHLLTIHSKRLRQFLISFSSGRSCGKRWFRHWLIMNWETETNEKCVGRRSSQSTISGGANV